MVDAGPISSLVCPGTTAVPPPSSQDLNCVHTNHLGPFPLSFFLPSIQPASAFAWPLIPVRLFPWLPGRRCVLSPPLPGSAVSCCSAFFFLLFSHCGSARPPFWHGAITDQIFRQDVASIAFNPHPFLSPRGHFSFELNLLFLPRNKGPFISKNLSVLHFPPRTPSEVHLLPLYRETPLPF